MGKFGSFLGQAKQMPTSQTGNRSLRSPYFQILVILVLVAITFAYSNHFSNSFQFDDSHTIENNASITQVDVVRFFTDATTFSSLASNQSYRPLTTLENAINYKMAGGLDPKPFHVHIFVTFLLTCALIFFFIRKLLDKLHFSKYNQFWALLTAAIFGLLCVNAETVNYIIQRSEITAALCVVAGLVAFLSGGIWRKYLLYLIFPFIGFFAKEMAFVFAPILLLYFLIFEEEVYLLHFYKKAEFKKCIVSLKKTLPAIVLTIAFYFFYSQMRPDTFFPGGPSQYKYLITQPMVMCHYLLTYFVPYNLSADTDWQVFPSLLDYRAIIGIVLVSALLYLALKASKQKSTRLFSFGLLWFFITLLPTSSFIPFAEVLNDHRTFIPYIGLTIAFVFGTKYAVDKVLGERPMSTSTKAFLATILLIFLCGNIYGIRERNKVWSTKLSLWKDVAEKSPKNGRGLMNYGLALMGKGDLAEAEKYYLKALEINPDYSTLNINLGILKNAQGDTAEAEDYFKKALELNPSNHSNNYYYARFLARHDRFEEAQGYLEKAVEISPNYQLANTMLMEVYHKTEQWENLKDFAQKILKDSPENEKAIKYLKVAGERKSEIALFEEDIEKYPSAEKYLDLSLKYYKLGKFIKTIDAAQQALKLKKDYPAAYNNIGIAYYELGDYDRSIDAYTKAVSLDTSYQLAKNNMKNAIKAKNLDETLAKSYTLLKTSDDFLNYSLECYKQKKYEACIEAAEKSITIKPSAGAYNNICAAYNQMQLYDKAIAACDQALKIDPNHKLAQGNRDFAVARTKSP
ncbi:tetratricopeptide repeat protein [Maribacter algicola]|uniref:Tetratricopeptide repeat protein n=1 Tax=Meishania litoralis TaxID=3434685 RepID=A0ACC7LMJ6_9FLAO